MPPDHEPILVAEGLQKSYGGIRALDLDRLEFHRGTIHAICGENGAGKSTLNRILSGVERPDDGVLLFDGKPLHLSSPVEGEALGIAMAHQESAIFSNLTAAENIALMTEPVRWHGLGLNFDACRANAEAALDRLGEVFPIDAKLDALSLAQRQMTAIAKALSRNCRVLILDEPTASLSTRETETLHDVLRNLRDEGVAILYVSHRLEDVFELADTLTVLRDGRRVDTRAIQAWSVAEVIEAMTGHMAASLSPRSKVTGKVMLTVGGLCSSGRFRNVDLTVHEGEIVGLAGLVGSGRSELARCIMGIESADAGTCMLAGAPLPADRPSEVIGRGLAYVPEDRREEGLHLPLSVAENAVMALRSLGRPFGALASRDLTARETLETWRVKAGSLDARADSLSGGNQQKLLLAKWMATKPKLLILDEPTRGVDVAAKEEIHRRIQDLASEGMGTLLISSELDEVLSLSDRIVVMRQGEVVGEVPARPGAKQEVLALALPQGSHGSIVGPKGRSVPSTLWVGLLLVLLLATVGIVNPGFWSGENLRDLASRLGPAWIMATAMALVVMVREIDISIGATMGFCAAMLGVACSPDRWGLPPLVGVLICLCCGLAVGLLNGVLVGMLKVPSIVVTLGTATILQGATEVAMGGRWITDLPPAVRALGTGSWLGIPLVFLAALAIGLLGWWASHLSPLGCRLRALGGDPGHAKLVGLPISKLQLLVFVCSGIAAAMAAAFSATQLQVIESGFGRGFELTVIAAVVVGGVSIRGGSGSVIGAWLGVALLGTLSTILIFLKLGDSAVYWERAVQGLVILLAVGLEFKRRRQRSL